MKVFIKSNLSLLHLNFVYFLGIWIYSTIAPLILGKSFGFSNVELSYYQNLYILAIIFGFAISSITMGNRISHVSILKWPLILLPLTMIVNYVVLHYGYSHEILYVTRFVEGLAGGAFLSIMNFILKLRLLKEENNGEINSYLVSLGYFLKVVIPILTIKYFVVDTHEENIYLLSAAVYTYLLLNYLRSSRRLSWKYNKYILSHKKETDEKTHANFFDSLKQNFSFFTKKDNIFLKAYLIYSISFRYAMRPFFDLYLGLFLFSVYNLSIEEITILMSLMVAGQASQALSGKFADKINLATFNIIQIIAQVAMLALILLTDIITEYKVLGWVIFYMLGFFRSMYANYDYKSLNFIIEKGSYPVNEISFIHNSVGELIHYLTYVLMGALLLFLPLDVLIYYPLLITVFLMLGWFIFDRKLYVEESPVNTAAVKG